MSSPEDGGPDARQMHDSVPADPVLDRVVEAWPNLPDPIRAAIATLVQAASKPVT